MPSNNANADTSYQLSQLLELPIYVGLLLGLNYGEGVAWKMFLSLVGHVLVH